ncbi:response regulator [Sandaracinus amylolyticus]|uniref:Response regulator n=1 Tax=Sandaracinus amylolyticus TaxID=927083 RepID=A0A0F6YNC0_9BACT|nr:response regulator [Sandaracinus amylolyticus]AKF11747.1 response regulator [Sandaracinus amylolyticus]
MNRVPLAERCPILVVDDDADVVTLARKVLEHAGWLVEATTDPRHALEIATRVKPCLVLVDLMMPHMDGEELLCALRAAFRGDAMPKIALISAAYSRAEVAKRLEVDASLAKPFDLDDLRDVAVRFASAHRDRPTSRPPPPSR